MENDKSNKLNHTVNANSSVISTDVLNRCISGRRGKRLQSICPSRLLTSGSAKKRVFLPSIPTRQEKSKENNSEERPNQANAGRGQKFHRGTGRGNRGRGRGKELIQLKGSVFGEGPPEHTIKKDHAPRYSSRGGGGGGGGRDGGSILQLPKYTPVKETKSDDEDDESLRQLFKDDFLGDDYDYDELYPVKLPLLAGTKSKKEEIKPDPLKIEIKKEPIDYNTDIKDEPMDFENEIAIKEENDVKNIKMEIKCENEVKEEETSNMFISSNIPELGELFFFHFPDCLPRDCFVDDDNSVKTTMEGSKMENSVNDDSQKHHKWSLKQSPEGFIGKLQILKSGKVRLKIGTICFDVATEYHVGFLQQVVSLKTSNDSGDLHILGPIKTNVVCTPELESLVDNCYI